MAWVADVYLRSIIKKKMFHHDKLKFYQSSCILVNCKSEQYNLTVVYPVIANIGTYELCLIINIYTE